jgi:hypothetical protein
MLNRQIVACIIRTASKLDFKVVLVPTASTVEEKLRPFCQTVWDVDMLPRVFAVTIHSGEVNIISIVGQNRAFHQIKEEDDVVAQLDQYLAYLQRLKERMRAVIEVATLDDASCQIWPMSMGDRHLPHIEFKSSYAIIVEGLASSTEHRLGFRSSSEYDDIIVKGRSRNISATKIIPVHTSINGIKFIINLFMISMRYTSDPKKMIRCGNCKLNIGEQPQICDGCLCLLCDTCSTLPGCLMCLWNDR